MNNPGSLSEQKYDIIVTYAPVALAEIDQDGGIVRLNIMGQRLLKPLFDVYHLDGKNIYPLLNHIFPGIAEKIQCYAPPRGQITYNLLHNFRLPPPDEQVERHFQYNINKIFEGCVIVGIEDLTEKYLEEKAMQQNELDKAVAQGKFEIASEVLHDIGNALMGFNSYLSLIYLALEPGNISNLQKGISFLNRQHDQLVSAIGAPKADALISLLEGVMKTEKIHNEEIKRSVDEQQHIIDHIREILNIHRQHIVGHLTSDRKPVDLKDIIHDCCTMLFASCEKKGITVSLDMPPHITLIRGDRTKLMQAILNLLKNSIEAVDAEAPEKRIDIELLVLDKALQLTIRDTGRGFDKDAGSHLFERGYTTKIMGTGLGLYNCKSIIECHSGMINIFSDGPGSGATTVIKFNI